MVNPIFPIDRQEIIKKYVSFYISGVNFSVDDGRDSFSISLSGQQLSNS